MRTHSVLLETPNFIAAVETRQGHKASSPSSASMAGSDPLAVMRASIHKAPYFFPEKLIPS